MIYASLLIAVGWWFLYPTETLFTSDLHAFEIMELRTSLPYYFYWIESMETSWVLPAWNPFIWGGIPAIGNPEVPLNPILYACLFLGKSGFVLCWKWAHFLLGLGMLIGTYRFLTALDFGKEISLAASVTLLCSPLLFLTAHSLGSLAALCFVPWFCVSFRRPNKVLLHVSLTYFLLTLTSFPYALFSISMGLILRRSLFGELDWKRTLYSLGISIALASHHVIPQLFFPSAAAPLPSQSVPFDYLLNLILPRLFNEGEWWPILAPGWSPWDSYPIAMGIFQSSLILHAILGCLLWKKYPGRKEARACLAILLIILLFCSTSLGTVFLGASPFPVGGLSRLALFPLLVLFALHLRLLFQSRDALFSFCFFMVLLSLGTLVASKTSFPLLLSERLIDQAHTTFGLFLQASSAVLFFWKNHQGFYDVLSYYAHILILIEVFVITGYLFFQTRLSFPFFAGLALLVSYADNFAHSQALWGKSSAENTVTLEELEHPSTLVGSWLKKNHALLKGEAVLSLIREPDLATGISPNVHSINRFTLWNGYSLQHYRDQLRVSRFSKNQLEKMGVGYLIVSIEDTYYTSLSDIIAEDPGFRLLKLKDIPTQGFIPKKLTASRSLSFGPYPRPSLMEESFWQGESSMSFSGCGSFTSVSFENKQELLIKNACSQKLPFVLNDRFRHSSKVELNDRKVGTFFVNGNQKSVWVPPGTHSIRVAADPFPHFLGWSLSLISVLCLTIGFAVQFLKQALVPNYALNPT